MEWIVITAIIVAMLVAVAHYVDRPRPPARGTGRPGPAVPRPRRPAAPPPARFRPVGPGAPRAGGRPGNTARRVGRDLRAQAGPMQPAGTGRVARIDHAQGPAVGPLRGGRVTPRPGAICRVCGSPATECPGHN